jgi:hypothetical protein
MAQGTLERRVKNLERRVTAVEQILPTLATKADLAAAIAPLPTKADVRAEIEAAVAPLATKADVRAEIEAAVAPLATKADVRVEIEAAIAPLATKADVRVEIEAAIAPLATKVGVTAEIHAAVRAEGVETRRHFDVVAEGLRADIRMVAEGVIALQARGEAHYAEIKGVLAQHDRRLTRLEASPSKHR